MPAVNSRARTDSVSEDGQPPRKRNRPGLSCHGCRRRKYKCDGRKPVCVPCERSQISCIYDADVVPQPRHTPGSAVVVSHGMPMSPASPPLSALISSAARSVNGINGTPAATSYLVNGNHTASEGASASRVGPSRDFRGSGFRTQFCGYTHSGSHFGDAKQILVYSKQFMDRHQTILKAHIEVRQRDKGAQDARKARGPLRLAQPMHAFLPSKAQTTTLVQLYMDTIDQCFHVLHGPTFKEQFDRLWARDLTQAAPQFLALVLLMCATVNCCGGDDTQYYAGSNSADRNTAANWIERVELWLGEQSQKHTSMLYYQIRCVLMLARFMTDFKAKRWWTESGNLYRFAIGAGMHADTATVRPGGKISDLEREMRRRIWATIEDIEMHTTIHRGLAPCTSLSEIDCGPPTNIQDDQLSEDMDSLPLPLKAPLYTPASPIIASRATYGLRRDLCAYLNSPQSKHITHVELISWEERTLTALQTIPQWTEVPLCSDPRHGKLDALPRALQRSELLELLLLLYQRALASPASRAFRHYSRQGRLTAAASIIRAYETLSKPAQVILVGMRGDVFPAAMGICLDICETGPTGSQDVLTPPGRPAPLELCALVESALDMLQLRAERITGSLKRFWLLGCALSFVRRLVDPDRAEHHESVVASRLGGVLYKQLSLQADVEEGDHSAKDLAGASATTLEKPPQGTPTSVGQDVAHSNFESVFNFEDLPLWDSMLANLDVEDFIGF